MSCALSRHVFPELGENDLIAKAEKRHAVKVVIPSELTPDNISTCDQLLGDAECIESIEETKAYLKKIETAKTVTPMAKPKPVAKSRLKKVGKKDYETIAAAQQFKPDVPSCELTQYSEWDTRWRISYPVEYPPFSHSCVFVEGDPKGSRRALFECLKWAWTHHTRMTNTACPWLFED